MLIDCGSCSVRGKACGGCMVSVLFGAVPGEPATAPPISADGAAFGVDEGADAERRALRVLADAGFEVTVLSRETTRPQLCLVGSARRRFHAA